MKSDNFTITLSNHWERIMIVSEYTIKKFILSTWYDHSSQSLNNCSQIPTQSLVQAKLPSWDLFLPLRRLIDGFEVQNPALAHRLCQLIPAQCPFARTLRFRDRVLLTIPPLCKLNPLYEELIALRFRALCYLADHCGEDVSQYC